MHLHSSRKPSYTLSFEDHIIPIEMGMLILKTHTVKSDSYIQMETVPQTM